MNTSSLEVWVDSNLSSGLVYVGVLHHQRGNIRFEYDANWLINPLCFNIDPRLSLDRGSFFPDPESGSFGMLLDSSPDRWGQTLMKRREAIHAKKEGRKPRKLYAWDYLIGVQDETRQGALRFKYPDTECFLGAEALPAPPVTRLPELERIAAALSDKKIEDLDALDYWLSVLVAPGASLGGARPKANFTELDGSLWIAKFPAKGDDRDVGAWEMLSHMLAKKADINVPDAKLLRFNSEYHTFCVKRFDRLDGQRIFYASAMSLLEANGSDGMSYLDIAEVVQRYGQRGSIKDDLTELFRRVIFNMLTGNTDDHLRNHGFTNIQEGWRLSPAFDVNPNIEKTDHVLNIDTEDNRPILQTAIDTAEFYDLTKDEALIIVDKVQSVVSDWKQEAREIGISRADVQLLTTAFLATLY